MRGFAWIAKLPNNGMAQCNLCATFRYRLVVARMFAVTKRVHATLGEEKRPTKDGMNQIYKLIHLFSDKHFSALNML